jgi:hypothetical protein
MHRRRNEHQSTGKAALAKQQGPHQENLPDIPIRTPADRHFVNRIRATSPAKEVTTLIEPGVDVQGDLELIRQGRALKMYVEGAERYTVNGRTWQLKRPSGTVFPVEGEGFIGPVDQAVMNALRAFARYNGSNNQSEYFLDRQGVDEDARAMARRIWILREKTT